MALVLVPCVLQSPALLGWLNCNPIYSTSGLGAAGFSPLTHGACWVDGNVGQTVQSLSGLSARELLSGHLPWWNHFSGAGLPLASEMQSSSFFLPFILLLRLFDGILYLNIVLRVLAGIFTFAFLREFGLGRFAALLGGILFELNGTFTWLGDAPIHPVPFLPLLLHGIERCRSATIIGRAGGQRSVAFGIAFSVLGGFPEVAFSDGIFALLWSLSRLDMEPRLSLIYLGKIVAGGLCGLLLSSPALIPFLHDLPLASVGGHVFAEASTVRPEHLASTVFPAIFGAPYADGNMEGWNHFWGYVTPATALLALLALAARPRDPRRLLLLAWFVFCLAGAYRTSVFGYLRDVLPGFNQIDFARYVGPSAEFAAITLAAMTLDQWDSATTRVRMTAALSVLLAVSAAVLWASGDLLERDVAVVPFGHVAVYGSVAEALLAVTAMCALLCHAPGRRPRLILGVIITGEALLLALPPVLSGTRDVRLNTGPVDFLRAHLGLSRFYAVGGALLPNYGAYFELGMVNEFYVPLPIIWNDHVRTLTTLETPTSMLGAGGDAASTIVDFEAHRKAFADVATRYLVVPGHADPLAIRHDPHYELAFDNGETHIYRLPDAAPYFEIVEGQCAIAAETRDVAELDCKQPARLLRREMAFRGWNASVNGVTTKVHTAMNLFQAVDVPAGVSTVRWWFQPAYAWVVGAALTAGLIYCVAALVKPWTGRGQPERRGRDIKAGSC